MKRNLFIFPVLAVFLFILSAIPVFADDGDEYKLDKTGHFKYELSEEGLTITSYEGSDKEVIIPDEIDGYKVSVIGKKAFKDNTTMTSVVIPEGVSNIKAEAFYGCNALSHIEFNAKSCTVTAANTFDGNAGVFSGAGSASPNGVEVIFGEKVSKVPDNLFDTASLDGVNHHNGHPYAYVTSVTFSPGIKEIGSWSFRGCRELETLVFGGKEQTIGEEAFWGCAAIKELNFGDALTSIGESAFSGNTALESITWGQNLDLIDEYAFSGCTALPKVTFVNPLTTISKGAFSNCTALKEVVLPETLNSLQAEAFYGCINLNHIEVECKNLSVTAANTYDGNAGVFSGAGSASVKGLEVIFGAKAAKVPDNMFDTASLDGVNHHNGHPYAYVTSVTFKDGVKEIGSFSFRNCQSLETINFGENIQSIGEQSFWGCSALTELVFNKELSSIGEKAFSDNTGLEKIIWGENLDSIGNDAFSDCISLTKVHFVNPITTIGSGAFRNCKALKKVILPESLTNLGAEAFYGCVGLNQLIVQSVNLSVPEANTYHGNAGVFSSAGSGSATGFEVVFYTGVKTVPANILDTASLDGVNHHNGYEHAYVTSIVCASTVTEVGDRAFRSCQSLEKIHFYGKDVAFGEEVFDNCVNPSFRIEGPANGTLQTAAGENNITFKSNSEKEVMPEMEEPEKATPAPASDNTAETWTCPKGHTGNTGKYCSECGTKKPE